MSSTFHAYQNFRGRKDRVLTLPFFYSVFCTEVKKRGCSAAESWVSRCDVVRSVCRKPWLAPLFAVGAHHYHLILCTLFCAC